MAAGDDDGNSAVTLLATYLCQRRALPGFIRGSYLTDVIRGTIALCFCELESQVKEHLV